MSLNTFRLVFRLSLRCVNESELERRTFDNLEKVKKRGTYLLVFFRAAYVQAQPTEHIPVPAVEERSSRCFKKFLGMNGVRFGPVLCEKDASPPWQ